MFDDKIRKCVRAIPGRSHPSPFAPRRCPHADPPLSAAPLRDWVTGYSKRKTQRRKFAVKQAEEKARKERLQERKERREEMKHRLGLDKAEEESEPVAGTVENEVVEYGSGVTVTVEGLD